MVLLKYLWGRNGGARHVVQRTMARRPFLTSFSWLAGESSFAGSNGYQSRKPDCREHQHKVRCKGTIRHRTASLQVVIRLERTTWDDQTVQGTFRRVLHSSSPDTVTAQNVRHAQYWQYLQPADMVANKLALIVTVRQCRPCRSS